jgi:predicted DCC family thiol-disulfide oxidoreductase YuxK
MSAEAAGPAGGGLDNLIVYDGVCVLCARSVRFVAARDGGRFRFVPLQSAYGALLAACYGIVANDPQTVVVVMSGRALVRSDAALAVLGSLPRYGWTGVLRHIPRRLRDAVYDLVARHRYRWFGRFAACPMPPPSLRERVLEAIPPEETAA